MAAKRDFTDRFLKSIKPAPAGKRIVHYDAQIPGFGVRVTDNSCPSDVGSFVLIARYGGSPNPTARRIGSYPAMSLAAARAQAREWLEHIRRGVDPKVKEAERQRQEARQRANTFAHSFAAYSDDRLAPLRTGEQVTGAIGKHVLPHWANLPISEIRRADVRDLVAGIRKDAPIMANRVVTYLKTFFTWCVDQELIEASPAAAVKRPSRETRRDRVLADAEIRQIWLASREMGAFGRAFRFMLATGQRRNECGGATWDEIDFEAKTWTLSRERTKADRAHEVPLSDLALSILEECPRIDRFVFSTGRAAAPSGWSGATMALNRLAPIAPWHLHDLRRTAATNMASLGADRLIIAKILNHADREVTGIYDRFPRADEKRRALQLWGARLASIVDPPEGNVVSIVRAPL